MTVALSLLEQPYQICWPLRKIASVATMQCVGEMLRHSFTVLVGAEGFKGYSSEVLEGARTLALRLNGASGSTC